MSTGLQLKLKLQQIDALNAEVEKLKKESGGQSVDEVNELINCAVDPIAKQMLEQKAKNSQTDAKLGDVDRRVSANDKTIGELTNRTSGLETQLKKLESGVSSLTSTLNDLKSQMEDIRGGICGDESEED